MTMWPWEHVVIGYVAYSILSHVHRGRSPDGREAVLVAFAALLPDLVDKPLAWGLGVIGSGYGPAHSLFVAGPFVVALASWWSTVSSPWQGVAFATGYLLHLPGDVFYAYVTSGSVVPSIVLWPVATTGGVGIRDGFLRQTVARLVEFGVGVFAGDVSTYTWLQLGLLVLAVLLWVCDGAPPLRDSRELTRPLLDRWF
jgi:uncharacterized membrane protein YjgN (DUF898 family)